MKGYIVRYGWDHANLPFIIISAGPNLFGSWPYYVNIFTDDMG